MRYVLVIALLLIALTYSCTENGGKPPPIAEGKIGPGPKNQDWKSAEFTRILRRRFPVGTPERVVVDTLRAEGFESPPSDWNGCELLAKDPNFSRQKVANYLACGYADPKHELWYFWTDKMPICDNRLGAGWAVDSNGRISQIDARFGRDCGI